MSLTVTASGAGSGTNYAYHSLTVLVLTGARETGGASASATPSPAEASVTPNFSNSLICFALQDEQTATAFTPAANNTSLNSSTDSTTGTAYMQGYYSGSVVASTPVTAGASAPTGSNLNLAAYEVQPSGVSVPAQDASTPSPVNVRAATATTALFTPPAGAVLTALVSSPADSGGTWVETITDSQGLTWTQRALRYVGGNDGFAAIYTATLPTPPTLTSTLAGGSVVNTQEGYGGNVTMG